MNSVVCKNLTKILENDNKWVVRKTIVRKRGWWKNLKWIGGKVRADISANRHPLCLFVTPHTLTITHCGCAVFPRTPPHYGCTALPHTNTLKVWPFPRFPFSSKNLRVGVVSRHESRFGERRVPCATMTERGEDLVHDTRRGGEGGDA